MARPRLAVGCHNGEGISLFSRNRGEGLLALDEISGAGFHFTTGWMTLNNRDRSDSFWNGRAFSPLVQGWGRWRNETTEWAQAAIARELYVQISAGDLAEMDDSDEDRLYDELGGIMADLGPQNFIAPGEVNEARDTGDRDDEEPHEIEGLVNRIRGRHPNGVYALSSYTGHEDFEIFRRWTPEWMRFILAHGSRAGRFFDKLRHVGSLGYEVAPAVGGRHLVFHREPFGPGKWVSAIDFRHELDDEVMGAAACQALIRGGIWVYFSSPGVIYDERFSSMPGFFVTPKLARRLQAFGGDMARWRQTHGGTGRPNLIEIEGGVEPRLDQAVRPDEGKVGGVAFGPQSPYTYRPKRDLRLQVIHTGTDTVEREFTVGAGERFELHFERARLVLGQAA